MDLLLAAVLQEAVHEFRIYEVPRLKAVKHGMAAVVGHPSEHGKTGHKHGVVVVPPSGLLAEPDKGGQTT